MAVIKRIEGKIKVGIAEMEKPMFTPDYIGQTYNQNLNYYSDLTKYTESFKWYDVKDSEAMFNYVSQLWVDDESGRLGGLGRCLKEGIEINSDLIEVKRECCGRCDGVNDECEPIEYVVLKAVKEEDNQDDDNNEVDCIAFADWITRNNYVGGYNTEGEDWKFMNDNTNEIVSPK